MESGVVKQFAKNFIAKGAESSAARKQFISHVGEAVTDGIVTGSFKGVGISAGIGGIVGAAVDEDERGKGFIKGAIAGGSIYAGARAIKGLSANKDVLQDDIMSIAGDIAKTAPGDASILQQTRNAMNAMDIDEATKILDSVDWMAETDLSAPGAVEKLEKVSKAINLKYPQQKVERIQVDKFNNKNYYTKTAQFPGLAEDYDDILRRTAHQDAMDYYKQFPGNKVTYFDMEESSHKAAYLGSRQFKNPDVQNRYQDYFNYIQKSICS